MKSKKQTKQTWQTIEGILSGQTMQATFNTHIRPLKAMGRQNGTLTLACRSNSLEWLENRLSEQILRAARSVDETIQTVEFVAPDEDDAAEDGAENPGDMALEGAYHRQADAVIKPHKVEVHTQYFRQKWRPKLGPLLSELVRELRQQCYYGEGDSHQRRDTVEVTLAELGKALGVSSRTITRALRRDSDGKFNNELLHYFIREMTPVKEYDSQKGRIVNVSYPQLKQVGFRFR